MTRREHAVWYADHDNGWVTVVAENQDGTWAAWAFPKNETASIDYIEESADRARAAALHALEWKSGHADCTGCCSAWFLNREARSFASHVEAPEPPTQ